MLIKCISQVHSFLFAEKNDNSFFHHFAVKRDMNAQRGVTSLMDGRCRSVVSGKIRVEFSRIIKLKECGPLHENLKLDKHTLK